MTIDFRESEVRYILELVQEKSENLSEERDEFVPELVSLKSIKRKLLREIGKIKFNKGWMMKFGNRRKIDVNIKNE